MVGVAGANGAGSQFAEVGLSHAGAREEFAALGVTDTRQLEALFLEHIKRSDLEYFTYVSNKKGTQYRQWAMVGMDNGVVALYNESERRHWSFMRGLDLQEYLN
jgi:hypothetical protein